MRILLIVPDGVGVRNYLYSSFLTGLQQAGAQVMLYHYLSDAAIAEVQHVQPKPIQIKKIPVFPESARARILRESTAYARLLRNTKVLGNPTVMDFWNGNPKGFKQKILYRFAEIFGRIMSHSYKMILKREAAYQKELAHSKAIAAIEKDFEDFRPDLVLNLHQRSPASAPVVYVAQKRKIETATFLFSWDNVPKARMISRYGRYLVWSDVMKAELELLYPEIDPKSVKVVGSPQFEFYFNEKLLRDKSDFFAGFGLDPGKKTVCFSSNDQTSPYEQNYLEDICEAVAQMEEASRPQILFRICPVDKSDRFDRIVQKYAKFVFPIAPDWISDNHANFASIFPKYNDFQLLANTVKHSDLVVNLGSTMAHDFAVFDKPCLYLHYDPVPDSVFKVSMSYQFQHFRTMEGLDAVGWINSKSEIGFKINEALAHPERVGKDRKLWMQRIIRHPLSENGSAIVAEIMRKTLGDPINPIS